MELPNDRSRVRRPPFWLLLLFAFGIAGCATTQLEQQNRRWVSYSHNPTSVTTFDLYQLCWATFARREYGKLFRCLDDLERRINAAKDVAITAPSTAPSGFAGSGYTSSFTTYAFTWGEVHPAIIHWMRAEVLIELGEPARAVSEAKASLASLPKFVREQTFWSHIFARARLQGAFLLQPQIWPSAAPDINIDNFALIVRETLALATALSGDKNEALRIAKKVEQQTPVVINADISRLTRIYFALGQYQKVLELYRRNSRLLAYILDAALLAPSVATGGINAIQPAIQLGSLPFGVWANEEGFGVAALRYTVFHSELETGDMKSAAAGYAGLMKNPYLPYFNNLYWAVLFDLGRIAERKGDLQKALDFYRRAIEQIEKVRSTINYEAGMIGFVGDKQPVYNAIVSLLFRMGEYKEAFEYSERAKARALVDLLAKRKHFALRATDPQRVRQLLAQTEAPEEMPTTLREVQKTRALALSAQDELTRRAPELVPLVAVPPVKLADIEAKVPPDEALVSYFYTNREMFAFVLTSQGVQAARLDRTGLEDRVRRFRRAIQSRSSDYLTLSEQLYDQLWRPIEPLLRQQKITITPHGILHYLPFSALNDGAKFVLERYSIRVLPSASTLLYLRSDHSREPGEILAFGNPDLGNQRFNLTYAQEEALEVAKILPDSKALVRKEATKAALMKFGPAFRYIHFATHGQFDADDPLDSALLLARTNKEDGRLTVGDLYSLHIDADLVSMSACETALGEIANGDDVIGLTRGFLYAGARSIVASLWQIDDKATEELMTRFYKYLTKTDKREALRKAQLEIKKAFPHPFFWAAFQLIGNAN